MGKNGFVKVVFLSFSVLFLFSSCQMFTTSWGKAFQRDQKAFLGRASASELLAFSQGANASSNETVKALLNLLSGKSSEELRDLSLADKELALNLSLDATLPMEKISQITAEADSLTGDSGKAEDFMRKLLNDTESFNTAASVNLLSDPDTMKNAAPDVLANAAVAVILQVAAKNGGYDKIQQNIDSDSGGGSVDFTNDSVDKIVGKMLGSGGSAEDKDALKAAVNVAKLLQGVDAQDYAGNKVSRPELTHGNVKLLGAVPLGDVLGAF